MATFNYCVQCTDSTSQVIGCFFYDTERKEKEGKFFATSPVFSQLSDFFLWAKEQGFSSPRYQYTFTMTKE